MPSGASPAVTVVHDAVPGRLRLEVAGLYRAACVARRLEEELPVRPAVHRASANPRTGRLLVLHDREMDAEVVVRLVAAIAARSADGGGEPEEGGGSAAEGGPPVPAVGASPASERAWHLIPGERVVELLEVDSAAGLTDAEAEARLQRLGANRLPAPEPRSLLAALAGQLASLPVVLLVGSSVLSAATGGVGDAVVILAVVALNAVIGTATEQHAERTITALSRVELPPARLLRGGAATEVEAERVVAGDVLLLSRGSWVAADARLLAADRLSVDESALTGESLPVNKSPEVPEDGPVPLAERRNMVYRGTVVTGGSGRAVVVATGTGSEMGRVHTLVSEARAPETPISRQLGELSRQLVWITGAVSAGVLVAGLLRGDRFVEMLKIAVSLAVAAVPEGLPAVATTTLAFGVRKMRRTGVLVRQLDAVETVGGLQVVCLDKTGTITRNRMTLVSVVLDGEELRVDAEAGRFTTADGNDVRPDERADLRRLLEAVVLCSEAELEEGGDGRVVSRGSPTETALVDAAVAAGVDAAELRRRRPVRRTEYRAEDRMYMTTEHGVAEDGAGEDGAGDDAGDGAEAPRPLLAVKGRPDEVLDLCRWRLEDGGRVELGGEERERVMARNERMAGRALRVLGVAYRELARGEPGEGSAEEGEAGPASAAEDLVWLGLVGIVDPVRDGVAELIQAFRRAGIQTLMITGDQSATAQAVGRQLDLAAGESLEILDSTRLDEIDDEVLAALLPRVDVFSRVSPSHKLQIVQALQRAGKVVAMTGDGINDGPALKAADIGIALGEEGSELARQVSDVVLEGDDVSGILRAVAQGRTIADDIRKSVHFIVSTNLSEVIFTVGSVALGLGTPLNPKQLLWINLLTDVFPELALAVEPPEEDVLGRPPRRPDEPIISRRELHDVTLESGLITGSALAAYGYGLVRHGTGPRASTVGFMSLTSAQLLHAITSRSRSHSVFDPGDLEPNRLISWSIGGGLSIQLLAEMVSGLRRALGTAPLSLVDLAVCGTAAVGSFVVNESLKYWRQHHRPQRPRHPSGGAGAGAGRGKMDGHEEDPP